MFMLFDRAERPTRVFSVDRMPVRGTPNSEKTAKKGRKGRKGKGQENKVT